MRKTRYDEALALLRKFADQYAVVSLDKRDKNGRRYRHGESTVSNDLAQEIVEFVNREKPSP